MTHDDALALVGGTVEAPLTRAEERDAMRTAQKVDAILGQIKSQELGLASNYAQLGSLLLHIRTKKYWIPWGHASFGAYIESLKTRLDKGRTQLYQVVAVAERLLPLISESDLAGMGLSKAIELKRVLMQHKPLSPELLAQAKDPATTVEQLRAAIFTAHNIAPDRAGTFRDVGGFYATAEEWEEIQRAFEVAARVDPVVPKTAPDWMRRKICMQRLASEFLAAYENLVERGEA